MVPDADGPGSEPPTTVSLDAVPVPVVGYDVSDGEPVIAATNDAFEDAFGAGSAEIPVRRWLERDLDATGPAVEECCAALADGTSVDTEIGPDAADAHPSDHGGYRLRTFDREASLSDEDSRGSGGESRDSGGESSGSVDGYLLLTEPGTAPRDRVAVDRIAGVISHDLRNPLDVAKAHLRAARETGDEEHFDLVEQSHDRMERIIRDVLTLTRGESALNIAPDVDIRAVASDAWATVETEEATLTLADDLPTTEADPDRLQRLFENLFRNSIEHARPDDPGRASDRDGAAEAPLEVRVGPTDDGFYVADDGVGIPPEERSEVFGPGYSTGGAGSGTGLGLTIVERIAEAHDWSVTLTAGSLDGARFEFELPEAE